MVQADLLQVAVGDLVDPAVQADLLQAAVGDHLQVVAAVGDAEFSAAPSTVVEWLSTVKVAICQRHGTKRCGIANASAFSAGWMDATHFKFLT